MANIHAHLTRFFFDVAVPSETLFTDGDGPSLLMVALFVAVGIFVAAAIALIVIAVVKQNKKK